MPNLIYISSAFILLVLAFYVDFKTRERQKREDPLCIDRMIDQHIRSRRYGPLVAYPLRTHLVLNCKDRYQKMLDDGVSLFNVFIAISGDARMFIESSIQRIGDTINGVRSPEEEQFLELMADRKDTARAAVAAYFHIPWSQLKETEYDKGFYIKNLQNGHVFRVPFKEWDYESVEIFEIDENAEPFAKHWIPWRTLDDALNEGGEFITEIEPPAPTFILGPF